MKKITLSFILTLLTVGIIYAQNVQLDWAKSIGGTSWDHSASIVIDKSGNIYTTGCFRNTVDFDPGSGTYNLTSAGPTGKNDIFIQKLNSAGNFIWAKSVGANGSDQGYSITLDASGNIYTTGNFTYTTDFDPGGGIYNLTSAGGDDIFIQKLDSAGNFIWAKSMGGGNWDQGTSITIDASGNIYTTGWFKGSVDFDPGNGVCNLISVSNYDIFIQKLNSAGDFIWAKSMGGSANAHSHSITLDASGNIYTTGFFTGMVDFDPGSGTYNLTSVGHYDIFIQKMDPTGNFIWAKSMGDSLLDDASSISIDYSGNIYTTGCYKNTVDFDPGSGIYNLTSVGNSDIFIQKLNSSGNFIWAKSIGGNLNECGASIRLDTSGNIYTAGQFESTVDFDPGSGTYNLTPAGSRDIFIQKLDSAGNFIWVKSMGGSSDIWVASISLDASGDIYTTGSFYNTADLDPGNGTYNLTSVGEYDIYIQKLKPINSTSFTTATKDNSIKLSISPNPNNGRFTLSINNSAVKSDEVYLIEIYDVIGNLLHSEEIRGGSSVITNMQMETLSKGMYFLSLKAKDNLLTSCFIVQ